MERCFENKNLDLVKEVLPFYDSDITRALKENWMLMKNNAPGFADSEIDFTTARNKFRTYFKGVCDTLLFFKLESELNTMYYMTDPETHGYITFFFVVARLCLRKLQKSATYLMNHFWNVTLTYNEIPHLRRFQEWSSSFSSKWNDHLQDVVEKEDIVAFVARHPIDYEDHLEEQVPEDTSSDESSETSVEIPKKKKKRRMSESDSSSEESETSEELPLKGKKRKN